MSSLAAPDHRWLVKPDLGAQLSELEVIDDRGIVRHDDIGLTVGARSSATLPCREISRRPRASPNGSILSRDG